MSRHQTGPRSDADAIVRVSGRTHLCRVVTIRGRWQAILFCKSGMIVQGYRAKPLRRGAIGFVDCEACLTRAQRPDVIVTTS